MGMSKTLDHILRKFGLDVVGEKPRQPYRVDFRRTKLPGLFAELGFKEGAEIGVEEGLFSEELCQAIPGLRLHCVDPWIAYSGYRNHVSQAKLDGFYNTTVERLKHYDCNIIREFSMDAVHEFENKSLDFVFIDGNHDYQNVVNDISEWSKKVRKGGVVSGHDYYKPKNQCFSHVPYAVDGYVRSYRIETWFVLVDDRTGFSNSWLWVKE
jgi:hypothetical protein